MPFYSAANADIRFNCDGAPYGDSWATASGGGLTADVTKTRPGAMGGEVAVRGLPTRDDVTLTIQMSDVVAGWHPRLEAAVGEGECKVSIALLGRGRTATGITFTKRGILSGAWIPDWDADSADIAYYTVTVALHQRAA